jgi:hypothetical protein
VSAPTPPWPPLDENGLVVWPTDHEERIHLARRLFGQALVQTMDYYLKEATHYASNPMPDRPYEFENYASCTDRAYRACFASMTSKQREITLHLVRRLLDGVVISSLSRLDQFGIAQVRISLVGHDRDGQPIDIPITSPEAERAGQFVECTEEFSEYASQLADDIRLPPGF